MTTYLYAKGGIANVRPGFVKGTKVGKRIVDEIVLIYYQKSLLQ